MGVAFVASLMLPALVCGVGVVAAETNLVADSGMLASEADGKDLPAWASAEIEKALARYRAWKGDDMTAAFTFVTDVHSRRAEIAEPVDWKDSKAHIPLAIRTAVLADADFVADLGDHDLDRMSTSRETLERRIASTVAIYESCPLPVLFCQGNHDHGRPLPGEKEPPVSNARFGETFNTLAGRRGHKLVLSDDKSWGYYDMPAKRTRAIFLNTSDSAYYGYSEKQVQFFADALRVPKGWAVVALQHYCIVSAIGHWRSWREKEAFTGKNAALVQRIAEDMIGRGKGSENGVTWDFTAGEGGSFAGFFCGDSHFDHQIDWQNVHYTISQGYARCSDYNLSYGAVCTPFERDRMCLFELVAVKPEKGMVKVFRVGAGGEARDRFYYLPGVALKR